MHAGLFDMLHDAGDKDLGAVANGVHVDLGRTAQVLVDQHRAVAGHLHSMSDVAGQLLVVAHDLHGPAAQHVRRTDHHRVADLMGRRLGLLGRAGDGVDGLLQPDAVQQLLEALAVFGEVDGVRTGA